ncbi:MAG: hypothetical protein ABI763_13670 [Bacteroidota bacterium]
MDKSNLRMDMLRQYLKEDPYDDFSEYALALEFENKGNRIEALFHLEQILNRNADYLAAYYQCGKMYEAEKDTTKAMDRYQQGMEIAKRQEDEKTYNELRTALEMMD